MSQQSEMPATLYMERPKIPGAAAILDEMIPRARPKHGRLPPLKKTPRHSPNSSIEETESKVSRPGTRDGSQDVVREFLKQKKEQESTHMMKEAPLTLTIEQPKTPRQDSPKEPASPRSKVTKVTKATGVLNRGSGTGSAQASTNATPDASPSAAESAQDEMKEEKTTPSGQRIKLLRCGTISTDVAAASGVAKLWKKAEDEKKHVGRKSLAAIERIELRSGRKPGGSLENRLKALDQKRCERVREDRLRMLEEQKERNFNEIPEKERSALEDAFTTFDIDNSGYLDHKEVVACLREFGLCGATPDEKKEILKLCLEATIEEDDPTSEAKKGGESPEPKKAERSAEDVQVDLYDLALKVVPCVRQAL